MSKECKISEFRILCLADIFRRHSNSTKGLQRTEIEKYLSIQGFEQCDRTIRSDFDVLRRYGFKIEGKRIGSDYKYFCTDAPMSFDLGEIKVLIDCVQSSRFIPAMKCDALIRKLRQFVSDEESGIIKNGITIFDRVKSENDEIFANTSIIQTSIKENKQITFYYWRWNMLKERIRKHDNQLYTISPYGLVCHNSNYYMVGYDNNEEKIKHYRVDKMEKVCKIEIPRVCNEKTKAINMSIYETQVFNMYGGTPQIVRFKGSSNIANVIIDHFGTSTTIIPADENHFTFTARIEISNQFFGWVAGLAPELTIIYPEDVIDAYNAHLRKALIHI